MAAFGFNPFKSGGAPFTAKPPSLKPAAPQDVTPFRGRSEISRFEFSKELKRDYALKRQLQRDWKLKSTQEVDKEIDKFISGVADPGNPGFWSHPEIAKTFKNKYWEMQREKRQGVPKSYQEKVERARKEKEYEFWKKKFGIK